MEIVYPDSGNDGHFMDWWSYPWSTDHSSRHHAWLKLSASIQLYEQTGSRDRGRHEHKVHATCVLHVWGNTQRNGSQKGSYQAGAEVRRELPSSNKELLHVPGQALGRGNGNRAGPASEELPTLEEKDSRICIHRTYSFQITTWKAPAKEERIQVPSTCIHGHKPVSQLPAPSPLRFFFLMLAYPCGLSKGYSSWEKATTRFF